MHCVACNVDVIHDEIPLKHQPGLHVNAPGPAASSTSAALSP